MNVDKITYRTNILIISMVMTFLCTSCLEPFPLPEVNSGYLVVEAMFTDDPEANQVILSYAGKANEGSIPVRRASIFVSDDLGGEGWFEESEPGLYMPRTNDYIGQTGRKYVLHIVLAGGRHYQSDTCLFRDVPPIDDFYWDLKQTASQDNTRWLNGLDFKIDTHDPENLVRNFLWTYDEIWETLVPWPVAEIYSGWRDFQPVQNPSRCFHYNVSSEIMLKSTDNQTQTILSGYPIVFISTESTRLWKKYRIRVRQFNLSDEAYFYHQQLNEITSLSGSIFDKQPSILLGNISNAINPFELVLGYFVVSGVSIRSITITLRDLPPEYWGQNLEFQECVGGVLFEPVDWWSNIDYLIGNRTSGTQWVFVKSVWSEPDRGVSYVIGLLFAHPECTACNGTTTEIPENWD